jgi:glycolate oxidase FAD binding subunit
VTALRSTVARLFGESADPVEGAPPADFVLAPATVEEAARILDFASEHGLAVVVWGGGTHQGLGYRIEPDLLLVTTRMDRIVDWQPDDLTVVVEPGLPVAALEARLDERSQTAVLPERPGVATVGGVVAAGASGWRRYRFGPTRERVLEVVVATGDGRVVRGGAQVVKNVTGYDIPRLVTGSLGSLGLIGRVCFKLWPKGEATATVRVDDPHRALDTAYRPLAVLETVTGCFTYLAGTGREVEAQGTALGGSVQEGLLWPEHPAGEVVVSVRVPPASMTEAVRRLPAPDAFVAGHGVGEVTASFDSVSPSELEVLRDWAESIGGALVLLTAPDGFALDPWGTPPQTLDLQRRIKAGFDPAGVMAPGRLPGGL